MVHNGIQYGVMAAYAEGLNLLNNADIGKRSHADFADKLPSAMRHGFGGHLELGAANNTGQSG